MHSSTQPSHSVVSPAVPGGWRGRLHEVFGCDLRSLAALRIGLGVAILIDVIGRAQDFRALYTDAGFLPSSTLLVVEGPLVQFSAHYWASGSPLLQGLVFLITAILAVALIVGIHTRVVTALCWYLVASVQVRQPFSYMGGDSMLRLLLFWSLFLPMASRYSWDAATGRARRLPDRLTSVATLAILLQVCLMYWATGLRKDGPLWWSGRALHYALHADLATPLGVWLREQHALLPALTYGALWLELLGPCLAFIPVATAWWRLMTIVIFWLFHVGLASTMNIGLFPLFSMVGWLAFLPTQFWTWCGSVTREGDQPEPSRASRLASVAAGTCLVYVLVLLAERARVLPPMLPNVIQQAGKALRIQQTWNMFAPDPRTSRSTFRLVVTRADGVTAEHVIGATFRLQRFVTTVVTSARENVAMSTVVESIAAHGCREPGSTRSVFIRRTATIHDEGIGEDVTRALAETTCGARSADQP